MAATNRGIWVYGLLVVLSVVPVLAAGYWRLWVLTAIPIGFLFGFFLQKGDLCGASAFSEVLLARDRRKVFGLWVAIVTAMCGFALLDLAGLVTLNPKPLIYWNYLVGGLLFGVGIVLAGGCVSGCLYKAGTGNLNSIVALLTIPVGIALVEYGPLHDWFAGIKKIRVANADGSPVTLSSGLSRRLDCPARPGSCRSRQTRSSGRSSEDSSSVPARRSAPAVSLVTSSRAGP